MALWNQSLPLSLSLSLSLSSDRASKQSALAHTSVLESAIQQENTENNDSHVNTFDAIKSRRYGTVHTPCGRR